jgi:pilus assembly protein Flp/PilA
MLNRIKCFLNDDKGATAIEYGLIAALIAIAIIGGVGSLGSNLSTGFADIGTLIGNGFKP